MGHEPTLPTTLPLGLQHAQIKQCELELVCRPSYWRSDGFTCGSLQRVV